MARFIRNKSGVHAGHPLRPLETLCGWSFTEGGQAHPGDIRAAALAPFRPARKTAITCPECCDIIEAVKSLETEPLDTGYDPDDEHAPPYNPDDD